MTALWPRSVRRRGQRFAGLTPEGERVVPWDFVDVRVDDIVAIGMQLSDPGVENAGTWTSVLSRQGGPVYCSAQVHHQNYGADLSARITRLYAAG